MRTLQVGAKDRASSCLILGCWIYGTCCPCQKEDFPWRIVFFDLLRSALAIQVRNDA